MKIYKERQYLVFDFEDGKTVKYDFANKKCIGKKGKIVNNLCSQLSGLTIDELCDCCTDVQYGKFLRFVKKQGDFNHRGISNIGTILNRVPHFSNFEQIFSAGIDEIVDRRFAYTINDIPKGLIKLCKNHNIILSNIFLKFYKMNPDAYLLAYNLDYISLTDRDIYTILSHSTSVRIQDGEARYAYHYEDVSTFCNLIQEYHYTAKALLQYCDYCKTFEAIEDMNFLLREIKDYASMMAQISPRFDKYPRHFLTSHRIASRNYNRLKQEFIEEDFKKRISLDMEHTFDDYCFIYPKSTQDIKDEAVAQNNCVASYIEDVIKGRCHILFLRSKYNPEKSLVTIEVQNNRIIQARQRFNYPVTTEQQNIINKWNNWYSQYISKKSEKEELKNAS